MELTQMVITTDSRKHVTRLLLHPYFTLLSRVVLGGVLIFAGIVKLPHTQTLIWEINQYHILPSSLATVYGHTLPFLELILGSLLVLGVWLKISTSLSGFALRGCCPHDINQVSAVVSIQRLPGSVRPGRIP